MFLTIFEASTSVDDNLHAAGVFLGNEADDIHAGNQIKGLVEAALKGFGEEDMTRHVNELQAGIALVEDVEMTVGEEAKVVRNVDGLFCGRK